LSPVRILKRFVSGHGFSRAVPALLRGTGFSRCLMSIPIRHSDLSHVVAGARTFFVTSSIAEKRNLLQSDRSAGLFVRVLYEYREQDKYRLHEFVVMPDHFHLLLTVGSSMTIEKSVQLIKGGFAFRAGRELGFKSPVWQRGFSEARVGDAEMYSRITDYIRSNPVRRRLVWNAAEFPHSSAFPGFELDPAPQGLKPSSVPVAERHG
jgi:putative transposase